MEQNNKQDTTNKIDPNDSSLPNFSKAASSLASTSTNSSNESFSETMNELTNAGARKSNKLTFVLVAVMLLFLLVGGALLSAVLISNGTIKLSNNSIREKASYIVGMIPFMPKTPEYVLMQSVKAHEKLASTYLKASVIINSDEIAKSMPIFKNGIDMAIEGPVDARDDKNPKMMLNFKITKEFDADFGVLDQVLYAKINKIPSFIYPLIGLTESNIKSAPFLNHWISYDISGLDTDARSAFENRDKQDVDTEKLKNQVEDKLKKLMSDKLLPLIKMTKEDLDGKPMYKLTLKMDEKQTQDYFKEFMKIIADSNENSDMYLKEFEQTKFKNLEAHVWINRDNYYFTKVDSVSDIEISKLDASNATGVLGAFTNAETMEPESDSNVLGVKTINADKSVFKYSIATSISLDRHGETFEKELTKPSPTTNFETFMLQMTQFMQNQQSFQAPMNNDGFGDAPYKYQQNGNSDGFGFE